MTWHKDVTSAPRVRVAILIHPGIEYHVAHVHNVKSPTSNSLIQARSYSGTSRRATPNGIISPTISGNEWENVLSDMT